MLLLQSVKLLPPVDPLKDFPKNTTKLLAPVMESELFWQVWMKITNALKL